MNVVEQFSTRTAHLVGSTILLLAVAALAGCSTQAAESALPPPPAVSTSAAIVREVTQWDDFNGRIEAVETVQLRPRVSGYIERVLYVEGQEVRKGDVLFTIDPRSYRAALNRAEADVASSRAAAQLARSEADRARKLAELRAVSTEQLEQRSANAAQAQASVQAAEAALENARLDLDFTRVRAPINGRAGRALVTAGNSVSVDSPSSVLTTVVSMNPIHVHFESDERSYLEYAQMARRGERVNERDGAVPVQVGLVGEDGFPHQGVVDFLDNHVDPSTGTIHARAVLDNSDRRFTPGLFARVRLPGSGTFKALLIDDKAVLTDQDRKYVYIVDSDGKAQRRDVKLGRSSDGLRIVNEGLAAGDQVIVSGVQKVFAAGMPVQAQVIDGLASATSREQGPQTP